jgi:hypothetical protein
MDWVASFDGYTWTTPAWPFEIVLAGLLVALLLLAGALVRFDAAGCTCRVVPPGGPLGLPGPGRCHWSNENVVGDVVTGFLAVVTLGLVIEPSAS